MAGRTAVPRPQTGSLPAEQAVACFEGDEIAARALIGAQPYARIGIADVPGREGETVVLVSAEWILAKNPGLLHEPNVQIIALSDTPFLDPRLDGCVYAYLPPHTPPAFVERVVENALDLIHLLATRREANEQLAVRRNEIRKLNEIGAALSAELDTTKLMELILTKSREITNSDAGSLYLVYEVPLKDGEAVPQGGSLPDVTGARLAAAAKEHTRKVLRFELAENDSISVPFQKTEMEISDKSIAGYVALTGEIVNLEDAYHLPAGVPYSYNRKFDEESGYRTKSVLAVPMRNPHGEIVGVVQLINAKRNFDARLSFAATAGSPSAVESQVVSFDMRQRELVRSLASQAAVALANSRLYEDIQEMLKGFVRASVKAIEARDPTTKGHSFQVANLTVALAEVADRASDGPYADLHFSREQMREIHYAALLHDFGKVGVREKILVKAKKLYPEQLDLIRQRFQFVKRSMQAETLKEKLDYVLEMGREEFLQKLPEFDRRLTEQIREVDEYFRLVLKSDEPTVVPSGNFDRLADIAARHFLDFDGNDQPLLTSHEVRLLSIRKGSLDEDERLEIERHVVHTYDFLAQIPWTREIRGIPEIARGHHEKLNKTGYPYKLSAPEIPLQTRMMTISDIFEALVARDRPYKKAITTEKALEILEDSVKQGELDSDLFALFVGARVFEKLKIEPPKY